MKVVIDASLKGRRVNVLENICGDTAGSIAEVIGTKADGKIVMAKFVNGPKDGVEFSAYKEQVHLLTEQKK